ncbi:hypothetical protein NQZ68_002919 [Dissostichus eleginoides]|nr:hypothetical protein NQZ68_002919 [Dissostichus eleginoides]
MQGHSFQEWGQTGSLHRPRVEQRERGGGSSAGAASSGAAQQSACLWGVSNGNTPALSRVDPHPNTMRTSRATTVHYSILLKGNAISCSRTASNTTLRQTGPGPLRGLSAPETQATGSQTVIYEVSVLQTACYSVPSLVSLGADRQQPDDVQSLRFTRSRIQTPTGGMRGKTRRLF